MKNAAILAVASAALASAQVTYYPNGTYYCSKPNAAYCAGDSLGTDIIIRCYGHVGQPGRCSNNLVGQPPVGVYPALCWQPSADSGEAACEKNCVVYGSSGNFPGTFTLPPDVCTPTYHPTTTTTPHQTTTHPHHTTYPTTTKTHTYIHSNTTKTYTYTHTKGPYHNGTTITYSKTTKTYPHTTETYSDTTVTIPPTTATGTETAPPVSTAGAALNRGGAMGALAAVGVVVGYLL